MEEKVINKDLISFPNVTTIASYILLSQTMNFNDLSEKHLDELLEQFGKRDFKMETLKSASLIIHEASHYFDNLATLSGQILLTKVYNAINEFENKNGASHIKILFDTLNQWKHEKHSFLISPGEYNTNHLNWTFNMNEDKDEISEQPFLSLTFKYNKIPVSRVPFSIESLWETNAIWAEVTYHFFTLCLMSNKDYKEIEVQLFDEKYKKFLYHPELLVYSVSAHLTSSFANTADTFKSFKLSKAISSISLNLPFKYYQKINRTNGSIFRGFANKFITNCEDINPNAVYMMLLENVVESKKDLFEDSLILNINDILHICGLPSMDIIKADILKEMSELDIQINGPADELYKFHKETGIHLFNIHGLEGGVNAHPGFFIDLAKKSNACIFQEDCIETEQYKRYDYYSDLERKMRELL